METCSPKPMATLPNPSGNDTTPLNANAAPASAMKTLSLRPRRGLVGLLAAHLSLIQQESSRSPKQTAGVLVSEASDNARLIGRVFGLGKGTEGRGLAFGDVVEVSRWVGGRSAARLTAGMKMAEPVIHDPERLTRGSFFNEPYRLADPNGGPLVLEASPYERWIFVTPEQVICRICRASEAPGFYPVADRLLLEHQRIPAESAGGLALGHLNRKRNPVARVRAFGPDVDPDDFAIDDWVWLDPEAPATVMTHEDGRQFTLARAGDIELNYGKDEPKPLLGDC